MQLKQKYSKVVQAQDTLMSKFYNV